MLCSAEEPGGGGGGSLPNTRMYDEVYFDSDSEEEDKPGWGVTACYGVLTHYPYRFHGNQDRCFVCRELDGPQAETADHKKQRRAAVRPGRGRQGPGLGGRQEAAVSRSLSSPRQAVLSLQTPASTLLQVQQQKPGGGVGFQGPPSTRSGVTQQRRHPQLSRLHDDALPGLPEVRHETCGGTSMSTVVDTADICVSLRSR